LSELRNDLLALKIDRRSAGSPPRRWALLLFLPAAAFILALYVLRFSDRRVEVTTVTVTKELSSSDSRGASAPGAPVLTASGYIVARRKAKKGAG
jgi:hypothetical protein